ncbi:MAG: hypothetical protein M0R76_11910 [Proteobacteria bacterium]|nr:hypothetical protein [Pseudomonadota bacterium]
MKSHLLLPALLLLVACALVAACRETPAPPAAELSAVIAAPKDIQALIDAAYALKQDGANGPALAKLEAACDALRARNMGRSTPFASCLDDRASVLLRLGRTDEAATLFRQAAAIAAPDPKAQGLLAGIQEREALLKSLTRLRRTCAEPETPPEDAALPYFPDVTAMQEALRQLTPMVAPCGSPKRIEPIQMRLYITGDGQLLRAQAKDQFAGTRTESCVVDRLQANVHKAPLPRFRACFRGFAVPFMIGPHPEKTSAPGATPGDIPEPPKDAPESPEDAPESPQDAPQSPEDAPESPQDAAEATPAVPLQNREKGTPPDAEGMRRGAQLLLDAFRNNTPDVALPFFFPAGEFDALKDLISPARYHKKLVQWYREDIEAEGARFRGRNWQVSEVALGRCRWKEPGTEANKLPYWSCIGSRVTATDGDDTRRFEIRVLINWGDDWYVTHLGPIRKD